MSPAAAFDHGRKLESYILIPWRQDDLLVEQDPPVIERYSRGDGVPWPYTERVGLHPTDLEAIACTPALASIVDHATRPPVAAERTPSESDDSCPIALEVRDANICSAQCPSGALSFRGVAGHRGASGVRRCAVSAVTPLLEPG
jgi:hypothetical protein